jgi:hypothetical protein
MNDKHRFDVRSEEEFRKEIKESTAIEHVLFEKWINWCEVHKGERPEYTTTGCGGDGEFLENKKVTTTADYRVGGLGPVEVKFAKPMLKRDFHLKASQTESYLRQGAYVLMFNGSSDPDTTFTLITPIILEDIVKNCKVIPWIGFGGKPSYKIPVNKFIWRKL